SMFKRLLPLIVLILLSTQAYSQAGSFQIWNNGWGGSLLEVDSTYGCSISITREDDEIKPSYCIVACKNSTAKYKLRDFYFNYYGEYIENIEWTIMGGGTLINTPTAPDYEAVVEWGDTSYGGISIQVTFNNSFNNSFNSQYFWWCVRLTDGPTALFDTFSPGEDEFCQGTPILFDNLSTGMNNRTTYLWDFGDDNFSTEFEPEHTFELPGTYEVTLTVTNRCGCSTTYTKEITITLGEPTIIWCPGVVAENDRVTYHVIDNCGGDWMVDGGTIVGGGDGFDYVEVEWDDVNPAEGFGYVHFLSSCQCPSWATVKIQVVTSTSEIQGDDVICLGEQKLYSLPQWPSTQFSWVTTTGTSIMTNQPNEILITGETPGTYTLTCDYNNTLLNYSGTVIKTIVVGKEIVLEGDTEFCSNSGYKIYSNTEGIVLRSEERRV